MFQIKKTFLVTAGLLALAVCSAPDRGGMVFQAAWADSTDINPNGSSELSLLMREMHVHALNARADVMADMLPSDSVYFDALHSAEPTSDHTKNEYYNTFAGLYLNALRQYQDSRAENLRSNYENLVSACIACHTTHCPGPMVVIRKLSLQQED